MAEFVVIYDSAAGSFISKQLGSAHLADAAVVSGKLGVGSVISGAIAAEVIGNPHVRSGVLDAAKLTGMLQDARLPTTQSGKSFIGLTDFFNDVVGEPAVVRFRRTNFGSGHLTVEFHGRLLDELIGRIAFFGSGDTLAYDFIGHDQATLASQFIVLYSRLPTTGDAMHFGRAGDLQLYMSGNIILPGQVDSVDISAHTHGAGAGDAPNILSASIGANILATPHFVNQGILSASLAAESVGNPHIRSGVLDAAKLTGTLQDARIPTTLAGRTFSGQVFIRLDGATPTFVILRDVLAGTPARINLTSGGYAGFGIWDEALGADVGVIASGNIAPHNRVDSVDISAHTHGAGAGDAPNILSASIASGIIGPHLASGGILSAHISSGLIGWPFLRNEGVLSAAIGANVLATPHFANAGILSASIASGSIGFVHLAALPPSAQDFWFGGTGDFTDAPNAWPYEWRRSQQPQASTHRNYISLVSGHPYTQVLLEGTLQANISGHSEVGLFSGDLVTASQTINSGSTPLVYLSGLIGTIASGPIFSQWGTLTPLVGQSVFCGTRRGATSAAITFTARAWIR